nr:SH3 domain-containing protein [uncultured Butyrivibrio sp.]
MKNIKLNILKFITIIAVIAACAAGGMRTFNAENHGDYIDLLDAAFPDNPGFVVDCSDALKRGGWDALANGLISGNGRLNAQGIRVSVDNGYMLEYVDQFKACGKLDANWQPASSSAKTTTETTAPAPQAKTEFTVTDLEPYSAWATQDCNIRSGADTTYDKAGSLKKYEEVTVTGKASTGWFRITTASGIEAYISDSLLTTENPSNREYTAVNDEGEILTYEFTDTKPEVIDEIIENIENAEEEHEHSYTSEVTTQPTCTATGVTTYTCECGDTYTEEISALGHTEGEWEVTKNATMLSDGEKVKKCSVCGEVLETEVIPANKTMLYAIITGIIGALAIIGVILGIVIKRKK